MIRIAWNGLTFGDDDQFSINTLTGWLELPGADFADDEWSGHGSGPAAGVQGPRTVLAGGFIAGHGGARNGLVALFRRAMIPRSSEDDTVDDLVVTAAGRTDTARAQLVRYAINLDPKNYASGVIPWSAQWRCPDPRVFGPEVSAVAPLLVSSPGASLPQQMPFQMPEQPIGGRLVIDNSGNDPEGSPAIYTLVGGQSGTVGLTNITTGRTVRYGFLLGASDVLVIDTERGGAYLNGAYRPSALGSDITALLRLAPGLNVIQALGAAGFGSPSIAVTARPASW